MTERWKIIGEEFISYNGGCAQIISNGECKICLWERQKDAQLFCDKLNEQHETIIQLKQENKELQFAYDECSNNKLFSRRKLETENKHLKDENQQLKDLIIIAGYTIKNNNGEITLELI